MFTNITHIVIITIIVLVLAYLYFWHEGFLPNVVGNDTVDSAIAKLQRMQEDYLASMSK